MTVLAWAALAGGLLCVPVAGPPARRWMRARVRLRRRKRRGGLADRTEEERSAYLRELGKAIAKIERSRLDSLRRGYDNLAQDEARRVKKLVAERAALIGTGTIQARGR